MRNLITITSVRSPAALLAMLDKMAMLDNNNNARFLNPAVRSTAARTFVRAAAAICCCARHSSIACNAGLLHIQICLLLCCAHQYINLNLIDDFYIILRIQHCHYYPAMLKSVLQLSNMLLCMAQQHIGQLQNLFPPAAMQEIFKKGSRMHSSCSFFFKKKAGYEYEKFEYTAG
jgi:hypothetical protein